MAGSSNTAQTALHAFARSRSNPVRKTVAPINKAKLLWAENLGWRLQRQKTRASAALIARLKSEREVLRGVSEAELDARLKASRPKAAELLRAKAAPDLALTLEVMHRAIGFELRDNQIECAMALLSGECVELRTGEGKTLAAGLAALYAARAGVWCHVITVNDYLAGRDHETMAPMAARLGLTTTAVLQDMEDDDRRGAYDADIVYGTNKSFVFDHLRDLREQRTKPHAIPRQVGQAFAICDEADSVLIDDATVPMILSEMGSELPEIDLELFSALNQFAGSLVAGVDRVKDANGAWRLTPLALHRLEAEAATWSHPIARTDEIVSLTEKALAARFQFKKGDSYVMREGKIEMIDQSTGRLMPDRRWEFGLQQLIELAAGADISPESRTVARITQQTFFRQYRLLSGLTGTARECRPEFWSIYKLTVRPIAAHAPDRLINGGLKVFKTGHEKWQYVARRAMDLAKDRAVLIGVNDVTETTELADHFAKLGQEISVLDALKEEEEATLVAQAGEAGRITLATHLAGRGTDIALDDEVCANGGLHVIIASAMVSSRLERQFYGRAGRAGNPGSYERVIALPDRMLQEGAQPLSRRILRHFLTIPVPLVQRLVLARLQTSRDRRAQKVRRSTLLREQKLVRQIGYV